MAPRAQSSDRGRFLVLDGIDGCGKSTQADGLARRLRLASGRVVQHLREPGSTALGEGLRELLLAREHPIGARAETLLFAAARAQMLEELVEPALARGEHVVCERFHPSTFAYQAVAGGLGEEAVLALLRGWAGSPEPDLVLWLDLPLERALERRGAASDRIERRDLDYQRAVARGYARYAELDPRLVRIDAAAAPAQVAAALDQEVARVLG
ncbi:MAG: dTMP kinase [Planctomycetes bacterium]|nr:dTMP kinase [Planctomycetota bacterium]